MFHYIVLNGEFVALDEHMQRLEAGAPPRVIAAFGTQAEATTWLENTSEPPSRALLLIGDQYHQAVYLRDINANVQRRALYPLSMADGYTVNLEVETEPSRPD